MAIVEPLYGHDYWVLGALPLAVLLELTVGLPKRWPRPDRAIGRLVTVMERGLRIAILKGGGGPGAETLAGVVLVTVVVGFTASFVWLTTEIIDQFAGPFRLIGRSLLIYFGLSLRNLTQIASRTSKLENPRDARRELVGLIGIDPGAIDEAGLQRACVEYLGASFNEAVTAPLFWFALAGPGGVWAYRAAEVLYRLVGSRKAGNLHFGRASVILERLSNAVAAPISWLLIVLSAAILGEDGGSALRIGWRDARMRHRSSEGWGLAAIVGALRVQVGGGGSSGSGTSARPVVGESKAPLDRSTVRRAVRIVQVAGLNGAFLAWSARIVLLGF